MSLKYQLLIKATESRVQVMATVKLVQVNSQYSQRAKPDSISKQILVYNSNLLFERRIETGFLSKSKIISIKGPAEVILEWAIILPYSILAEKRIERQILGVSEVQKKKLCLHIQIRCGMKMKISNNFCLLLKLSYSLQ